jgi:hypothetical protein
MAETKPIVLHELLEKRKWRKDYRPPAEDVLFTIQGNNIGSRGNFICLSGLPKAGKSTFLNAIIASNFTTMDVFQMKLKAVGPIGYFDTESSQTDFYRNMERIRGLAGYIDLPDTFTAYNTRVDPFEHQKALIQHYIETNKPDVVVIDGFLDLVRNYNDEAESRALMDWLKGITAFFNLLIIGVIHLGKKDNHTLGHFGSMVDRYAQSVLEIVKDKENNMFVLNPKWLRSSADFIPVAIQSVGNGYQQVALPPSTISPTKKRK